jgi:hypothetical protein
MIHNLFLTDHGLEALGWAGHVLNVCVKSLFGTILIIPLARKLHANSLGNALNSSGPHELVEGGVNTDIAVGGRRRRMIVCCCLKDGREWNGLDT